MNLFRLGEFLRSWKEDPVDREDIPLPPPKRQAKIKARAVSPRNPERERNT